MFEKIFIVASRPFFHSQLSHKRWISHLINYKQHKSIYQILLYIYIWILSSVILEIDSVRFMDSSSVNGWTAAKRNFFFHFAKYFVCKKVMLLERLLIFKHIDHHFRHCLAFYCLEKVKIGEWAVSVLSLLYWSDAFRYLC